MATPTESGFRPFLFETESEPPPFEADTLPLRARLGWRGACITLEGDFASRSVTDEGLAADVAFLERLELGECCYGAASCEMRPFVCELRTVRRPLSGADVLEALRTKHFRSAHTRDLSATSIPFPGYHPGNGRIIENDEIHDDFREQHLFKSKLDEDDEEYDEVEDYALDPEEGTHGELLAYVTGKLWYVLLHGTPKEENGYVYSPYVLLFAVGISPRGNRLVGVVTHQVCHNLCD